MDRSCYLGSIRHFTGLGENILRKFGRIGIRARARETVRNKRFGSSNFKTLLPNALAAKAKSNPEKKTGSYSVLQ